MTEKPAAPAIFGHVPEGGAAMMEVARERSVTEATAQLAAWHENPPPLPAHNPGRVSIELSPGSEQWVSGSIQQFPEYSFLAKVYPVGSDLGLDGGRISKLELFRAGRNQPVAVYDRGWISKPLPFTQSRRALNEVVRSFPEGRESPPLMLATEAQRKGLEAKDLLAAAADEHYRRMEEHRSRTAKLPEVFRSREDGRERDR